MGVEALPTGLPLTRHPEFDYGAHFPVHSFITTETGERAERHVNSVLRPLESRANVQISNKEVR